MEDGDEGRTGKGEAGEAMERFCIEYGCLVKVRDHDGNILRGNALAKFEV